jgi:diguanylate cyclase (GGDEF)-like protein
MPTGPILIIDDEPSNLATLKQILGDSYALVFARNGSDGLAAARKHRPGVILLDINMPDLDGYTVCRSLKADPLTENTPVIFVSALSEVGDEAAGFACGAVDYIIKPVSPSLVHARVRTHLSLVRAATLEHYVRQLELEKAKTARLSRIHEVLSGINSAIVRVREPDALVQEACQIAVRHGGFGMAWIGLRQDAQITVAASRGRDQGSSGAAMGQAQVLAPARSIFDEVLASGSVVAYNDVRLQLDTSGTCRDACERGFLSVLGVPLGSAESTAGALILYADDAGFFDDQEIKLLSELAGDMSFALQSIESEKRANFLSYYDALTGLPNTALFLDRLDQLIEAAHHAGGAVFIITLNLDRFKQVNDALGRHVGDHALAAVAKRLGAGLSRPFNLARVGADNFVLAGEAELGFDGAILCEQIVELIEAPLELDGKAFALSVRLGLAMYPDDAIDAESLFRNAESALKQGKLAKARIMYYSSELYARIGAKIELENMLKAALSERQFVMHYQAKVDLRTGEMTGAEALIRWRHPVRGMISPAEFIALAEETGLIVPMGKWVIRTVCAQLAAWRRDGLQVLPIAINLSAVQLKEDDIVPFLQAELDANGLTPALIELELTESLVMHDPDAAEIIMRALRSNGIKLSLDDFGTGYSSLAYLKRFPFSMVKIDRAFVTDITHSPDDAAIAVAIIAIAHNLRMQVIAEGVETPAQLEFLRARNCDQIQGFFFSTPVPAEEFCTMIVDAKRLDLPRSPDFPMHALLVVDEDVALLSALKRSLRGEDYRILTASTGLEALELLAMNQVQVILCDQRIQKESGNSFLTTVAQMYPNTTRIVLSGYTELQSVLDAVNRGDIYRFLTKPWDDHVLRQNIRDAFKRYAALPAPPSAP